MNPKDESTAQLSSLSLEELLFSSRIYAGIGARATPVEALVLIRNIARHLARRGLTLRSGAARGADAAFEAGCDEGRGRKEVFLPWQGFNRHGSPFYAPPEQAETIAALCHPNWRACSPMARRFHARNVQQVYGRDLKSPVDFVLFWAPEIDGEVTGGTATAVTLARQMGIPTFNLSFPATASVFHALC